MAPSLHDGDLVIGWKWGRPRVGQVVVIRTVTRPLIKRIVRIEGEQVWAEGDNKLASTDSRQLGSFHLADIAASLLLKF